TAARTHVRFFIESSTARAPSPDSGFPAWPGRSIPPHRRYMRLLAYLDHRVEIPLGTRRAARTGCAGSAAQAVGRQRHRPAFPREPLEVLGYNLAIHGQKTFNGVAILSKLPFDEVTLRLPGDEADDHARFVEAVVSTRSGILRIASLYLPNGNPPATDKYVFK